MTEETNHKTYKLGLALSGGGAKGFAHIGVFRLLEECGLKPDIIVGTSVGSLMGRFVCRWLYVRRNQRTLYRT